MDGVITVHGCICINMQKERRARWREKGRKGGGEREGGISEGKRVNFLSDYTYREFLGVVFRKTPIPHTSHEL